jgi:tagatose 1,6-diphosphate aldolase
MNPRTVTPGRWRGLKTTSGAAHVFTIMAFDQRGTYVKMLPENAAYEQAITIKREVVDALSAHTSAVLLDATYGLPAALSINRASGLLMALEKSGYSGTSTYRQTDFDPDWTVEKIKKMGASAVKLLVYYHPQAGELATEIENLVHDVAATCHNFDLPLFVEPISYSLETSVSKSSAEFAARRPEIVRETARRFSQLEADVLKLEFPVDADFNDDVKSWLDSCEAVSRVCEVPWVLLSAGVDFSVFERQVDAACRSGASGFLAGRAIWKECVTMSPDERQRFLQSTAIERLNRLSDIAHQHGRAWTDFYQPIEAAQDWYITYN